MRFFRSPGHFPNAQSVELDTREQRAKEINERYAQILSAAEHADERDRLKAIKIAQGDVRVAKHLMFGQLLFDTGRVQS